MPPQETARVDESRLSQVGSTNVPATDPANPTEASDSASIEDSPNKATDTPAEEASPNKATDTPAGDDDEEEIPFDNIYVKGGPWGMSGPPVKKKKPVKQSNLPLLDFDDILPIVGEFGPYQQRLFLLMIPFAFFVAFVYFTQIFITLVPDGHWCLVHELRELSVEDRIALSIPKNEDGTYSKCRVYDVDFRGFAYNRSIVPNPNWPTKLCDRWEYNKTQLPYRTISTDYHWVCDKAYLPHLAQSIFFCGSIFGGLIFGWMADRFGRVTALIGTNLAGFVAGVLSASTTGFFGFAACRFVVGLAFDNCFTMMYILVLEYVGPKWRTFVANMSIAIFFTAASCSIPWLSLLIGNWRWICILTSAPLILVIVIPWYIPESARWLVSQGKLDEAVAIIRQVEEKNKVDIPEDIFFRFIEGCEKLQKEEQAEKTYSVMDLFKSSRLRYVTVLLILIWMAISLVFDGHVRNVSTLGLDVFVTFTIASATEFPADTFLTLVLDRWGRRWLAFSSMVISGIFSLLATQVTPGLPSATLAILGRFSVNISYNIGLQYAAELLPTVVRAQGVALIHIMGYVSSILSPFVVYLATINPTLPLTVLGTIGIIGGVLALFLPETMDKVLPQTMADGENFGKDQSFFDLPCCKSRPKTEPEPSPFKRDICTNTSITSLRASIRGEHYRSNIINRSGRAKISNLDAAKLQIV